MITLTIQGKCISKDNEKLFSFHGKPFLSKKYKDFEYFVQLQAKNQIKNILLGDIQVTYNFFLPDKRHCDLTNMPKSIQDALNGIVWKDDKQIKQCFLYLNYDKINPRTVIYIKEI